MHSADVEKTYFPIDKQIDNITAELNQRRCELKSYHESKPVMKAIQQQMAEAKKNKCTNALKEVKWLWKEFGFTAGML